jgi:predicted RNase H-like nuclease
LRAHGSALLHSKKTIEGQRERLEILKRYGVMFDPVRERNVLGRGRVAIDDLIDAAGCLVSAKRVTDGKAIVLGDNTTDQRGLRMEIVA